jgi:hypothetical protein
VIIKEQEKVKEQRTELRKFALTVGIALCVLGIFLALRGKTCYMGFLIVSVVLLLFGIAAPMVLKPLCTAWMALANSMGWVVTRIILTVLFYLIVTPVGLLGRLFGKSFLDVKLDNSAESYWVPPQIESKREDYERQF